MSSHDFISLFAHQSLVLCPVVRDHPDREPADSMAAGAGAHAEGVPCCGPGGPQSQEGDVPGQAAASGAGSAGNVALPRAL